MGRTHSSLLPPAGGVPASHLSAPFRANPPFSCRSQYDKARNFTQLINLMYNDAAPALVVYAASEADVQAAVRFAAQRRRPLCVRSGGHDSTGASICDKGVVVDISQMNQVGSLWC